jgi:hypothetical protein
LTLLAEEVEDHDGQKSTLADAWFDLKLDESLAVELVPIIDAKDYRKNRGWASNLSGLGDRFFNTILELGDDKKRFARDVMMDVDLAKSQDLTGETAHRMIEWLNYDYGVVEKIVGNHAQFAGFELDASLAQELKNRHLDRILFDNIDAFADLKFDADYGEELLFGEFCMPDLVLKHKALFPDIKFDTELADRLFNEGHDRLSTDGEEMLIALYQYGKNIDGFRLDKDMAEKFLDKSGGLIFQNERMLNAEKEYALASTIYAFDGLDMKFFYKYAAKCTRVNHLAQEIAAIEDAREFSRSDVVNTLRNIVYAREEVRNQRSDIDDIEEMLTCVGKFIDTGKTSSYRFAGRNYGGPSLLDIPGQIFLKYTTIKDEAEKARRVARYREIFS